MNEQPSLEQLKKKQSKNVKTVLLILLGIALLSVIVLLLLNRFLARQEEAAPNDIAFYPVTDQNIFENETYLSMNRFVLYCEDPSGYGLTTQISDADRMSFNVKVRFAEEYLNILTYGDARALRALCTENYLAENSVPDFTQQMIYDARIVYYSTEGLEDGSRLVTYRMEYKIYQNNGTYRRDVGSDAVKPEYLVLRVSSDETEIKIENILRS